METIISLGVVVSISNDVRIVPNVPGTCAAHTVVDPVQKVWQDALV